MNEKEEHKNSENDVKQLGTYYEDVDIFLNYQVRNVIKIVTIICIVLTFSIICFIFVYKKRKKCLRCIKKMRNKFKRR